MTHVTGSQPPVQPTGKSPRRAAAPWSLPALLAATESVAERFPAIALAELGDSMLLDRVDRKFLLPATAVPEILANCLGRFQVLEVSGRRLSHYRTTYFDSADLTLYRDHLTGRLPRRKVRVRDYVDSALRFLEVKQKTNKGRTVKSRHLLGPTLGDVASSLRDLAPGASPTDGLQATVMVSYRRLTLVALDRRERVTFDLALEFAQGGAKAAFPGVTIIEVKQPGHARSWFADQLRPWTRREGSISKYCLGVAALDRSRRHNNYLDTLRQIRGLNDRTTARR